MKVNFVYLATSISVAKSFLNGQKYYSVYYQIDFKVCIIMQNLKTMFTSQLQYRNPLLI